MNESAGDQLSDVVGNHLALSRTEQLDASDDADEELPAAQAREGLPRSFRMRHDAHYVDELMSRAADGPARDRDYAPRRAPAPSTPPAEQAEKAAPALSPARLLPALGLIAERLESIAAHAGGIRPQPSAPSFVEQSLQVDFIRTTRLARAAAILHEREALMRDEIRAQEIADEVVRAAGPVARLAGLDFDVAVDDGGFAILAEAAMVVQGVVGTVDAIVDLLLSTPRRRPAQPPRQGTPKISISLQSVTVRPAIILDLFCPTLTISNGHAERFFENADEDYRGAPAAGVLLAAAAHIVRAHGGRADIKRHATGATITYVFPQTP